MLYVNALNFTVVLKAISVKLEFDYVGSNIFLSRLWWGWRNIQQSMSKLSFCSALETFGLVVRMLRMFSLKTIVFCLRLDDYVNDKISSIEKNAVSLFDCKCNISRPFLCLSLGPSHPVLCCRPGTPVFPTHSVTHSSVTRLGVWTVVTHTYTLAMMITEIMKFLKGIIEISNVVFST